MPRKTPARVSGIKPRATRSFSDPVSVPLAPRPVQLATPTLVRTENQIVLATLMICCVVLLGAFGTSMAAGIINLSGQNNPPILFDWSQCTDGDSAAVTLDYSQIYPSAGFVAAYGTSTNNLIKFDPFTASTARCQDATKYVALKDQCYIDIYGSLGYVGSSAVASCAPTDKRCRVMDRFAYPVVSSSGAVITSSTKYAVGGWNYLCKNGCVSGACVKNPIPVCFDSDLSSTTFPYISGTSDPYVKGTTVGFMNGVSVNVQDSCFDANQLTEYYCSNGQVLSTGIACANGSASGSCVADISVKRQESTLLLSQYVLGKSNQNN